jgi:uncharacterized membrane protein YdcZ (DUF606 family)
MNKKTDFTTQIICIFLALIFFISGVLLLPFFIGIFFLIAGYYCHKKSDMPWWIYIGGFLFSFSD